MSIHNYDGSSMEFDQQGMLVRGMTLRGSGVETVHSYFTTRQVLDLLASEPALWSQVVDRVDLWRFSQLVARSITTTKQGAIND